MSAVQATTISGKMIQKAKWDVESLQNLDVGHPFRISISVENQALIRFLSKTRSPECTLEKEGKSFSIILGFVVEKFSHMLVVGEKSVDSMAWIKPMDRTVESVLLYQLEKELCDPRFIQALQSQS